VEDSLRIKERDGLPSALEQVGSRDPGDAAANNGDIDLESAGEGRIGSLRRRFDPEGARLDQLGSPTLITGVRGSF
jgi:hypothetical protein